MEIIVLQYSRDKSFIVHSNSAFRAVENPFFLRFAKYLRPAYDPSSRYVLTTRYLASEQALVTVSDIKRLEGKRDFTLLLDGWDDALHRSIYGSLLAEPGEFSIMLSLHDLTGHRGTADKC